MAVLNMLILIDFTPPIQEILHWLKTVGTRVRVAEFEVNYGEGLSVPQSPDE